MNNSVNYTAEYFSNSGNINLIFGLLGCILNGFVCYIIGTHRSLRQPFNYLILNLAISDFLVSLAVTLNSILNYVASRYVDKLFSIVHTMNISCKFIIFCSVSSFSSTTLTLLAISVERYLCFTAEHQHKMRLSTTRKVLLLIWFLALSSSVILAYYGRADKEIGYDCCFGRIKNLWLLILCITLSILITILPILMMSLLYIQIGYRLQTQLQISTDLGDANLIRNRKKYLRQSVIAIIIISVFTCSTGLPFILLHIIFIIEQHNLNFVSSYYLHDNFLGGTASLLFLLSPILNPLLYNLASSQFRSVVWSYFFFFCNYSSKFTPERSTKLQFTR
ncbi:Substance-K receptor [Trichoplax sp. H2]|nr:Substance-K receptor [Trichoplax sp. H2]|eukprot:RDD41473.1 Substance-K receptor [Trichoplax sp. H2]